MKFIITGNYQQYLTYLRQNNETKRTAYYVRNSNALRGYSSGEIIFFGTPEINKNIDWDIVREYEEIFKEKKLNK